MQILPNGMLFISGVSIGVIHAPLDDSTIWGDMPSVITQRKMSICCLRSKSQPSCKQFIKEFVGVRGIAPYFLGVHNTHKEEHLLYER